MGGFKIRHDEYSPQDGFMHWEHESELGVKMHTFKITKHKMLLDDVEIVGCSKFAIVSKASEDYPTVILEIDCENVIIEDLSNP